MKVRQLFPRFLIMFSMKNGQRKAGPCIYRNIWNIPPPFTPPPPPHTHTHHHHHHHHHYTKWSPHKILADPATTFSHRNTATHFLHNSVLLIGNLCHLNFSHFVLLFSQLYALQDETIFKQYL